MATELTLRVEGWEGPDRWRWALRDPTGALVADHDVVLDQDAPEYGGFVDLLGWLETFRVPDDARGSARRMVGDLGAWIGREVLGPIGPAIVRRGTPAVVRVVVPEEASALLHRPFELAYVDGRPLALLDVSLIFTSGRPSGSPKQAIGEQLRILAVFSLPDTRAPLSLRRERYRLQQLVEEVRQTQRRAIELVVVQYGVTLDRLRAMLEDGDGWDVVHVAGHGLAGGVLLERPDGTEEHVEARAMLEMLAPTKARLKLVVLSTCESASPTIDETRRWLGLPEPARPPCGEDPRGAAPEPVAAVAQRIVRDLDCAVLAMRYPVNDAFAVGLGLSLYRRLLDRGRPLPECLQMALREVWADGARGDIAFAPVTPALFGELAASLRLKAPPASPALEREPPGLAHVPPEPANFVGRVGPVGRAAGALAPASPKRAVLFHGMPGVGKTACAMELVHRYEHGGFEHFAWYTAPDERGDVVGSLQRLAQVLETQVPGMHLVHAFESDATFAVALAQLKRYLGRHAVLIVLDNIESLLTPGCEFHDRRWQDVMNALLAHDGYSRVVLTTRLPPRALLRDGRVLVEPIRPLSLDESLLLAHEQENLGALLRGSAAIGPAEGRALVRRALAIAEGHPQLLALAEQQGDDPRALSARLATFEHGSTEPGSLEERFAAREARAEALPTLRRWASQLVDELADDARTLFYLLSCLEKTDRVEALVARVWGSLWSRLDRPAPAPPIRADALVHAGLVAAWEKGGMRTLALHPVIAGLGEARAGEAFAATVHDTLGSFWASTVLAGSSVDAAHLVAAARRGVPYLIRRRHWDLASDLLGRAILGAPEPSSVNELLPHLRAVALATRDEPRAPRDAALLGQALIRADRSAEAEPILREALRRAIAADDPRLASSIAGELVNALRATGHVEAAQATLAQKIEATRRAGLGPWSQLADECLRLQLLADQRLYREALAGAERLLAGAASLPGRPPPDEVVIPHQVREHILAVGRDVAQQIGESETALGLNTEIQRSQGARGASAIEQARARFLDHRPMIGLGRLAEAEAILKRCKRVFEEAGDVSHLGGVFGAFADLEERRGHPDQAVRHHETAMRYAYRAGSPDGVSVSHFNMASRIERLDARTPSAFAHRLAAAVIDAQAGHGKYEATLRALARHLSSFAGSPPPAPASFDGLVRAVEQVEGVQFRQLFDRLPPRFDTGDEALLDVMERVRSIAPLERERTG